MSRCPGYVSVTVSDWTASKELFHQDLVVMCPAAAQFSVTFYLPRRRRPQTTTSSIQRVFLVTLNDTAHTQQVFLTAVQLMSTHRRSLHQQSSEVDSDDNDDDDDDDEVVARVLVTALNCVFFSLLILSTLLVVMTLRHDVMTLRHRMTSRRRSRRHRSHNTGWRTAAKLGVFVLFKAVYSLAFTFSGLTVACRLLATDTTANLVVGNDSVSELLKKATSALRGRLAELEQHGGLRWLDVEDQRLDQLHSSLTACSQYVDDLLASTSFQISQRHPLNVTSRAVQRLGQLRTGFLRDVETYVESEKTRLAREVGQAASEQLKLSVERLLTSSWFIYPRSLSFHSTLSHVTSSNVTGRTAQLASFIAPAARVHLNAPQQWATSVGNR